MRNYCLGRALSEYLFRRCWLLILSDDAAIDRRRRELKEAVSPSHTAPESELPPMIQCALSDGELHDSAQQLLSLKRQVDILRLKFLMYPKAEIKRILDMQGTTAQTAVGFAKTLAEERTRTIEKMATANAQLRIAEHSALNAPSVELKNMATSMTLLEKSIVDILNAKMKWLSEISSRVMFYRNAVLRLLEIKGFALKPDLQEALQDELSRADSRPFESKPLDDVQKDYQETVKLWRVLVDKAYEKTYATIYNLKLPALPEFPGAILETAGNLPQTTAYRDSYKEAVQIRDAFWKLNTDTFDKENDALHRLLLTTGQLRAELLQDLLNRGDYSPCPSQTNISRILAGN